MSDKISREDAQAEINGLLVAEICRDFGINFLDVYPRHILERGVGPEQAFIGLAIKRGHLALPAVQPDAAAIREAALVKALDAAFPIVRKASVAAKMDAVNASPSDPTALRREAWIRECDAALELVVSALALIDNPRKEVVPSEPNGSAKGPRDIGPGDQAVAGAAGPFRANPEDWTEDYAHENGNYMCLCVTCGKRFCGHKRRVTCRVCAKPEPVAGAVPVTVQEAARVLEENVTSSQYQDAIQVAMLHGLSQYKAHAIIGGFLHPPAQKADSHE